MAPVEIQTVCKIPFSLQEKHVLPLRELSKTTLNLNLPIFLLQYGGTFIAFPGNHFYNLASKLVKMELLPKTSWARFWGVIDGRKTFTVSNPTNEYDKLRLIRKVVIVLNRFRKGFGLI